MKNLLLLPLVIAGFTYTAKAQEKPLAPDEYRNHIGKTETLCDTVYSIKIYSDTLTILSMGGNIPNQRFTIAVKGNKIQLDWANLKRKHLCITGTIELYKNTIRVIAAQTNQIVVSK
jgi:hypothetical protein